MGNLGICETRGWTDELALSPSGEPISKIWLATFVDAQVEIEDRKANLRILSWNSGGILTRMKDIQRLLVQTHPHLLLLQEARSINGNHNALVSECRAVGSSVGSRGKWSVDEIHAFISDGGRRTRRVGQ